MKLLCQPYLNCETNACSWMSLELTPEVAAMLLRAALHMQVARNALRSDSVPLETDEIELRLAGVDLQLFDDDRLTGSGVVFDSDWFQVAESFEVDDDQSTVIGFVGARFALGSVVLIFHPEHYKGTAESVELSFDQLEALMKGGAPFEKLELSALVD